MVQQGGGTASGARPEPGAEIYEACIADLRAAMDRGELTVQRLVAACLERIDAIDRAGPQLRAVIEVNPDALDIAAQLDAECAGQGSRGPLHGIPILLKDNIDTADRMATTAGSLALLDSRPAQDATLAWRLREAGAVILGKTNLSEWANFRSTRSISGWSGRGGQTRNPYVLDRSPCGSSSGSGAAVAASLCAVALGTETNGSIVCPASVCGVVGLKPTVGLTSRAGVVPISASQDTVGPHARCVADAALLLGALVGVDERDPATAASAGRFLADYTVFLERDGLSGARIGVARKAFTGYHPGVDALLDAAIEVMRRAGATVVDPVALPGIAATRDDEREVMLYEFKAGLEAYLASRMSDAEQKSPRSLADLIAFNQAHAADEMPWFGQELLERAAEKGPLTEADYLVARARSRCVAQAAIDGVLSQHRLDALIAPTRTPAWLVDPINGDQIKGGSSGPAANAGYPLITVPAGHIAGLPVGLTFMGTAFSEPTLIRLAYAYEQVSRLREPPEYWGNVGALKR
jgi:amidase